MPQDPYAAIAQPASTDPYAAIAQAPAEKTPDFWDKVKTALHPRSPLDMPGAKTFEQGSKEMPGSSEGANLAAGLADYDKASGGELGGGVVDILHGNVARGIHRILSGAGSAAMPMAPFALPAVAAAPITTGLSVGGGMVGSKVARAGAEGLGATPDQADLAGDVGGLAGGYAGAKVPAMAARAALLGRTPAEAYQSALKPSTTIPTGKVQRMVQTGLEHEIPVSETGVKKISDLLSDLQDKVTQEIGAGQGKTIDPQAVAARADALKSRFATQVNPDADLQAIDAAKQEFLKNNPTAIPAADAQAMKQGTYRQLGTKAYGEMKTATIEAQKSLARGLKEEIATQFPELNNLNAEESKLYDLQDVLEKAVQRIGNHQLLGIGTPIAASAAKAVTGSNQVGAAAGIAKMVLDNPSVKSRLAIAVAKASGISFQAASAKVLALANGLGEAASSPSSDPSNQGGQSSASGGTPNW